MKPIAPRLSASRIVARSSDADMTTTGISDSSARNRRSDPNPVNPGMPRSSSTRSNVSPLPTACSNFSSDPKPLTDGLSSIDEMMMDNASSTNGWSSMIAKRIALPVHRLRIARF